MGNRTPREPFIVARTRFCFTKVVLLSREPVPGRNRCFNRFTTFHFQENQSGQIAALVRPCLLGHLLGHFVIHFVRPGSSPFAAVSFPSCQLPVGPVSPLRRSYITMIRKISIHVTLFHTFFQSFFRPCNVLIHTRLDFLRFLGVTVPLWG